MQILVTGGAGFIGSHTVVALAEAGFQPVIVDDFSNSDPVILQGLEKILGAQVPFYAGDVCDPAFMADIFDTEHIEGIIHFAAYKAVGESMEQPLRYYRNNLVSLMVLLDLMQQKHIRPLIFSSSCTVYGEPDQVPVDESTPVKPAESVYGNTKQIGEEILRDTVRSGAALNVAALRYFNPAGAHPSAHIGELPRGIPANLVPFITQTAAGLRPQLTVFGNDYPTPDGSCIRDFIHVLDLAEAHVAALQHLLRRSDPTPYYDVFNIGTGKGASVLELIGIFEEISGKKLPYTIGPRRSGDIISVYANAEKAARELGWKARRDLHTCMADAWRWQQSLVPA
jgi:UDP-glucose 4-epimerase